MLSLTCSQTCSRRLLANSLFSVTDGRLSESVKAAVAAASEPGCQESTLPLNVPGIRPARPVTRLQNAALSSAGKLFLSLPCAVQSRVAYPWKGGRGASSSAALFGTVPGGLQDEGFQMFCGSFPALRFCLLWVTMESPTEPRSCYMARFLVVEGFPSASSTTRQVWCEFQRGSGTT